MERVKESIVDHFAEVFGYSDTEPIVNIFDLQAGQKGARDEAR